MAANANFANTGHFDPTQTIQLLLKSPAVAQVPSPQFGPIPNAPMQVPPMQNLPNAIPNEAQNSKLWHNLFATAPSLVASVKDHENRAIGNWESDNALDLGTAYGTPVYAMFGGSIGNQFGSLGSSDPKMAGLRLHLQGADDELYYQHLSKFAPGIKPGVTVKPGQLLGYTGRANGVDHLHIGDRTGAYIHMLLNALSRR
jgi:murein DD-endopeptidase MepM/ murein hydrolase activator NlpD